MQNTDKEHWSQVKKIIIEVNRREGQECEEKRIKGRKTSTSKENG